jgi:hypothetical protein
MILVTDFIALVIVSIVSIYLLVVSRHHSEPVYRVMKIMAVVVALLWIVAAFLYSQQ